MANVVTVSGMFGEGHTYFADAPVVIDISGLDWGKPVSSPFTVVRVEVVWLKDTGGQEPEKITVGDFREDTGGQESASFDIASALQAIWSGYDFSKEVAAAQAAADDEDSRSHYAAEGDGIDSSGHRTYRAYILRIWTEYLASDGEFVQTQCEDKDGKTDIPGGQCLIGGLTEWERSLIPKKEDADASYWEHTGVRNGDASTKPTSSPERVGKDSITSWVDVSNAGTKSIFFSAGYFPDYDDIPAAQAWNGHAPLVLRDSQPYIDFLFVNRRGAVETCSALMKEALSITAETTEYSRVERPTFKPSRSLMTISAGGRRSWSMSSGKQTREWLEWWTMEFLPARQKWMLYRGPGAAKAMFVPVTVTPAKKSIGIYDRSKQQLESVEFTVTLGLEG